MTARADVGPTTCAWSSGWPWRILFTLAASLLALRWQRNRGSIQFAFVAETRMDVFIDGLVFIVEDLWSAQVRQAVIENATRQARIWAASLKYPPFLWPISDRENTAVAISSLRNFGQLSGCLTGRAETDCDPYCISRSRVLSSTRRLLPRRTKPNQQAKNHHSLQHSSDESYPSTDGVGAFPHRIYTFPVVGKM